MKSAGTVLVTYPAYWAFALPSVKDKQRSAHADMSVIPTSSKSTYMNESRAATMLTAVCGKHTHEHLRLLYRVTG